MSVLTKAPSYRHRVEAVIFNKTTPSLTVGVIEGYPGVWMFPGGGVEQGETPLDALKKECLEEAAVAIKHIERYKTNPVIREIYTRKDIDEDFTHTHTIYYACQFSNMDYSQFGNDGDGARIIWMELGELKDYLDEDRMEIIKQSRFYQNTL